jgi:hypothetical protein
LFDARTMDDGQWAITKAHLEDVVLGGAKNTCARTPAPTHTAFAEFLITSSVCVRARACMRAGMCECVSFLFL